MDSDIFRAGVSPGAPTSRDEIKVLICHMLCKTNGDMTFEQLHAALSENSLVNYFELVSAVDDLVESGHITLADAEGADRYTVAELGRQAAHEFERSIPASAREKAVLAADRMLRRERREAELGISVTRSGSGYSMELSIPDAGGALVSFSLFLPTREECELVRRRFLNDPVFIYKGVLALLTGDRDVLGEILPEGDKLY